MDYIIWIIAIDEQIYKLYDCTSKASYNFLIENYDQQ